MKTILLSLTLLITLTTFSQTEKKYIYLENNNTGKIKKLNLNSTRSLDFHIDTLDGAYNSYITYNSGDLDEMNFSNDSVEFSTDGGYYWSEGSYSNVEIVKSIDYFTPEPYIMSLGYYTSSTAEVYISRQTKFGAVMFALGGTLAYTAFLNSVFVSPMLGLNDGKFSGYSFSRLWRGELYSAIGLSVGIPLLLIFKEKSYHFQSFEVDDTWSVVEPEN